MVKYREKFRHINLEKGYDGEVKFDQLLENILEDRLILNDLLFDVDTLISNLTL